MSDFQRFRGTDRYLTSSGLGVGGQLRARARAAAARARRAGHRQDAARRGDRRGARASSSFTGRSSRRRARRTASTSTTPCSASTTRASATATSRTSSATSSSGRSARRSRRRRASCCSSTRSTRPTSSFPNDLLHELDRMRFVVTETGEEIVGERAAGRDHHVEQREGAARRVPAPLRVPLHRLPRPRADGAHRARAPSRRSRRSCSSRRCTSFYELREMPGCASGRRRRELIDWIAALRRAGLATKDLDASCRSSACCSSASRTCCWSPSGRPADAGSADRSRPDGGARGAVACPTRRDRSAAACLRRRNRPARSPGPDEGWRRRGGHGPAVHESDSAHRSWPVPASSRTSSSTRRAAGFGQYVILGAGLDTLRAATARDRLAPAASSRSIGRVLRPGSGSG